MKKTVIGMIIGMMIMATCGFAGYVGLINHYESELAELSTEYEQRISELETGVWNMMAGNNYDISAKHDNMQYHFSKSGEGLLRKTGYDVIK